MDASHCSLFFLSLHFRGRHFGPRRVTPPKTDFDPRRATLPVQSMERGRCSTTVLDELPGSLQHWHGVLVAQWNKQQFVPMKWKAAWAVPGGNSRDMLAQPPSRCLKWNVAHKIVFEEVNAGGSSYQGCWTLGLQDCWKGAKISCLRFQVTSKPQSGNKWEWVFLPTKPLLQLFSRASLQGVSNMPSLAGV